MPDDESQIDVPEYKFPVPEKKIGDMQVGGRITRVPASILFGRMFDRIPDAKIIQNNAYGAAGGDLIQHANLQSRAAALRGVRVDALVEGINPESETVRVRFTFPTYGNPTLWGNTPERTILIPYNDLLGPVDKAKRVIRTIRNRLKSYRRSSGRD